ncbi:MAG: endonuclease/exonuclease/phosphatase family protein [Gammaproteobacteria bacterium]
MTSSRCVLPCLRLGAGALCATVAIGAQAQQINEIRIDQPSSDNSEYFELFGAPGTSLNDLTYVAVGDGAGGSGVIDTAVSLSGQTIGASGFFVAAESTFALGTADLTTSINFENSDNVTHFLVSGFTGAVQQDLDTNDDGVLDIIPWTAELDRIAVIEQDNPPTATEFHYGPPTVGPDGTFAPAHVKRCPDGDSFDIGAFDPVGGSDTPGAANSCATATTFTIAQIQGAAHTSPLLGARAVTTGVVTAVTGDGFYIQDIVGDGDATTSEGIYVFTGTTPTVIVANTVEVEGTVSEFTPGGTFTGNLSITQLTSPDVSVTAAVGVLPAPTPIRAADLPSTTVITDDGTVPFDPENDPLDFYETFEGMLVIIEDAVAIAPRDRFDEIIVLPNGGAGATGLNARGGLTLTANDNNPERIELQLFDTFTPGFDPQVTTGDMLGDVTGVFDYRFGFFEVRVTQPFTVTSANLTPGSTTLAPTADAVTIASYNVLNLDPLLENPANCQDGEGDIDDDVGDGRFTAIANDIVNAMNSPDIIGLQEVQDGNGCEDTGLVDASLTYLELIAAITAAGGPTYDFAELVPVDGDEGGQPGGNIRNGYLYNAARAPLVANSMMRIIDSDLGDGDAFSASRRPLLAKFDFNGEIITVINMHSSSKGGSSPLFGATFPAVNGREENRAAQSAEVNLVVDQELANDADANIVVLGDMNEFEFTQSVFDALTGEPAPVLDVLTRTLDPVERYSFIFNGNSQALDHAVVSSNLSPISELEYVHVNSEFSDAVRGSDHDPLVVRLTFGGAVDTDGDGVTDDMDNCTLVVNPSQLDTNGDGFGNICDADLNNDGTVNVIDLGIFRTQFFQSGANDADFNGDNVVNVVDLGILRSRFFQPPGPSGVAF